ncbi:radical SAM family heme chaperone HemW [Alphaproteobacteria bacterium]|nr:radical SAM family heme chaperone HemW [Alphaproteobacteria bacterium]
MINKQNPMSLYVHWPYCEAKCPYCDFNSHVIEKVDEDNWIKAYSNQLYEYKSILDKFNVKFDSLNTIFFGGGTPSLMPIKILENILNISSKIFKFEDNIEITLEANPSSYERKKFKEIKKLGINRLSIGVQSLNDENLQFLGRKHNYKDAETAIELARNTFDNVSIDLIYAIYGQKIKDWDKELRLILNKFDLNHLSLYQLTIEEGTKFFKDYKKGLLEKVNNDLAADFFKNTEMILNEYNFNRYEISNFSKEKYESIHNLNYWNSENWIGIGPGAYGRLWCHNQESRRCEIQNYKNPKTWLAKNYRNPEFENINFFNNHETDIDTLIMGLRLSKGIEISKLFNKSIIKQNKFLELEEENLIIIKDDRIKIHDNHIIKLNSILNYLIN